MMASSFRKLVILVMVAFLVACGSSEKKQKRQAELAELNAKQQQTAAELKKTKAENIETEQTLTSIKKEVKEITNPTVVVH